MANHKTVEPINVLTSGAALPGVEAWWSSIAEHQSRMLDFISHRLTKDADAVREISICRNRADASAVQWKWVEDTFRDYSTEATKMVAIYTRNPAGVAQNRHPRS